MEVVDLAVEEHGVLGEDARRGRVLTAEPTCDQDLASPDGHGHRVGARRGQRRRGRPGVEIRVVDLGVSDRSVVVVTPGHENTTAGESHRRRVAAGDRDRSHCPPRVCRRVIELTIGRRSAGGDSAVDDAAGEQHLATEYRRRHRSAATVRIGRRRRPHVRGRIVDVAAPLGGGAGDEHSPVGERGRPARCSQLVGVRDRPWGRSDPTGGDGGRRARGRPQPGQQPHRNHDRPHPTSATSTRLLNGPCTCCPQCHRGTVRKQCNGTATALQLSPGQPEADGLTPEQRCRQYSDRYRDKPAGQRP